MEENLKFSVTGLGQLKSLTRVMLKDTLALTGAEVSANCLPAGRTSPFAHAHKRNEEIYLFTSGKGLFWLDGKIIPVAEGSAVRVSADCFRALKADDAEGLCYFCIQVDTGSLVQATRQDGIISDVTPQW
ncbi:MAG TPA: cupin domain-containing protein [Bacteroidales bacterium]|nr:cupin domain-containing protein [Bacteroidales bacterium]